MNNYFPALVISFILTCNYSILELIADYNLQLSTHPLANHYNWYEPHVRWATSWQRSRCVYFCFSFFYFLPHTRHFIDKFPLFLSVSLNHTIHGQFSTVGITCHNCSEQQQQHGDSARQKKLEKPFVQYATAKLRI